MSSGKLSKEEYQKQKDLDAARKAGTAPPELDEEGNEINPHIPQYIVKAPWYLDTGAPTLKHQRMPGQDQGDSKDQWYARGARAGPAATKYRKGACANCGAMTHKQKDCLERPRKKGAKWTGDDIQADEVVQDVDLSFEAKRDRWNGYDAELHVQKMQEWELVEEQRKKIRAKKVDEELKQKAMEPEAKETLDEVDTSSDEDDDEYKYADKEEPSGAVRQTLRIREDTAKYLRNLDLNSAHYDPKTRSMRDNPYKGKDPADVDFAGDNFVRYTGEARSMTDTMVFAWQAGERGADVHLQANPSQAEFLYREYLKKKDQVHDKQKASILERYGGAEHLAKPPPELLQQTEEYVEYSRTGRVIKGVERAPARSKYAEDVFPQNHTSVWGSYWTDGQWGYACCHNTSYNSYCTGEAGKEAAAASSRMMLALADGNGQAPKSLVDQHRERLEAEASSSSSKKKGKGATATEDLVRKRKHVLGEGDVELSKSKLDEALERERKRQKGIGALPGPPGEDLSEEGLEAYRMLRRRTDDPMLNYKDSDV
ncbi:mRNA splicing protein [Allomyces javanicus]|nr:mRNA splicing protein [Allomyces javanicus]